ncbi:hypothetical protein [Profundibacter amoris]|uniref:Uncharacterized protein n=1 Tax=Profundibacter amoris TaxID=2171755 RepID=A0A347UGW1_9RHOB|nr:hypothetical protein [Profundibacter amoris]AXX98089.1 hypothetical protein BAR1_09180 [Profundibacter amoris]
MKRIVKRKRNKRAQASPARAGLSLGAIIKVNGKFLQAFVFGACAWWLWPSSLEWWGLGMISLVLAVAAAGKFFEAIKAMVKLYAREKELARLSATARAPVQSDLANDNVMEDAGMFDD